MKLTDTLTSLIRDLNFLKNIFGNEINSQFDSHIIALHKAEMELLELRKKIINKELKDVSY